MNGTAVVSIHDDSPCPVVGTVVSHLDDEHVLVLWLHGDELVTTSEALDELMPRGGRLEYVTIVEPTPIHDGVVRDMPRLMRRGRRLRRLIGSVSS